MKDDRPYLEHIREALEDIAIYGSAGREAFFAERMRQDAILRKLQVIGQAVKNLSETTKAQQPNVRWKQIAAIRDKVIHDYFWGKPGYRLGGHRKRITETENCSHRPVALF